MPLNTPEKDPDARFWAACMALRTGGDGICKALAHILEAVLRTMSLIAKAAVIITSLKVGLTWGDPQGAQVWLFLSAASWLAVNFGEVSLGNRAFNDAMPIPIGVCLAAYFI